MVRMTTIEDRVRELISQRGSTQAAFAGEIGLDATKLSKSLNGARRFSSFELAMIAATCEVSVDYLLTGEVPAIASAARASVGSSSGRALELAHEYAAMRADLAAQGRTQSWRLPTPVALKGRFVDQGAALAAEALRMVTEAGREASEPLWELIPEVFGIDVAIQDLGEGFDGLAIATDTARLILVNRTALPGRQRFTIAHELGHLLASDDQQIHSDADIYGPEAKRGESEMRANAFAAAFLMPEPMIRSGGAISEEAFCELATRFGVSPSALAYRMENLRVIDQGTRERWIGISAVKAAERVGRSSALPALQVESLAERAPSSLLRDTFEAYRAGEATLRPYAGLLGVDTAVARRQLAEMNGE